MTTEATESITYLFHLANGRTERIELHFDPQTFLLLSGAATPTAEWTRLDFHPCQHCPLATDTNPLCPFAHALSAFIHRFDEFYSYEKAVVEVATSQRTVIANRPLQDAMASILGLVGATSGCPHLAFFRPLARFHLPFASEQETLVRIFSMHLMGEYLRSGGAGSASVGVDGLEAQYRAVALVNQGMAERIRAAFAKDAVVNAIVILDTFAQAVPFVVRKALKELRPLFDFRPVP
jgi:hypothetical protein